MEPFKHPAPLYRILGCLLYDTIILVGLLMIAGLIAILIHKGFTGYDEIQDAVWFQLYLLCVIIGYFMYFWRVGGQTVGMKAWRLKLISSTSKPLKYRQMLCRLLLAILYYGTIFGLIGHVFDKKKLAWLNYVTKTQLIVVPK